MKVNVKGLVFVGFAAAILSGAAKATGENIVTSQAYTEARYQTKLGGENKAGIVKSSTTAGAVSYVDIADEKTDITGLTNDSGAAATGALTTAGAVKAALDDINTTATTEFGAAGATTAGTAGIVPAPAAGKNDAYLRGDKTWVDATTASTDITGLSASSTDAAKDALTRAYDVKGALDGKQDITSGTVYKVGYNGGWSNLSAGVSATGPIVATPDANTGAVAISANTASNFTNVETEAGEIGTEDGYLPTARAVKTYVDSQAATAAGDILENTALSSGVSNKAPTVGLMYNQQALDEKVANRTATIANTDTAATTYPTTGAVVNYAQEKVGGTGQGGKLVTAGETAGAVTYTSVESTGANIPSNSTALPTSGAVADYVASQITAATNGNVIPQQNTTTVCGVLAPCALVSESTGLHWRTMATGTHGGGTCGDATGNCGEQ